MKKITDESIFFIYLLEQYALHKNMTGKQTLDLFVENDMIKYIYYMYYTYHTERLENAIKDIDKRLQEASLNK